MSVKVTWRPRLKAGKGVADSRKVGSVLPLGAPKVASTQALPAQALPEGAMIDARLDRLEEQRSWDVDARLDEAREVERLSTSTGTPVQRMRARLVAADMMQRLGRTSEGARQALEVNAWALTHGQHRVLARSHLVLSSVFEGIGDVAGALDHAVRSMELLDDDSPPRVRGQHLLRLADILAVDGSVEAARQRYAEAEAAFLEVGDVRLRLTVLNNLTMLEHESGNDAAARAAAERLFDLAPAGEFNPDFADTIARARLGVGDLDGAEAVLETGHRLLAQLGDSRAATPAELDLTHARVLLASGRPDAAELKLESCLRTCRERDLEGVRVEALAARAELLAAREDFEGAYHAHRLLFAESAVRSSNQKAAAARTRQALFETDEARREAQRFWEQARTDPLTGLWNRRYVDEELPRYLVDAPAHGLHLVVAILDLDRFKRINDDFGHDVGDQVLVRLAVLLAEVIADVAGEASAARLPPFAGRLGGEEFILVQAVITADRAVSTLETLRLRVAGHPWAAIADGLLVTLSAGAALAGEGQTTRVLLERADRHLYAAKAAGRDRIVSDAQEACPLGTDGSY